jgi:hypothetical protein
MRKVVLCLLPLMVWLSLCCSRSKSAANHGDASNPSVQRAASAPQTSDLSFSTEDQAYALNAENGILSYCDKRGGRKIDLRTRHDAPLERPCPVRDEPNAACSGLSIDVSVRAPLSEPNDIVDIGSLSFPLKGRVHDCSVHGKLLGIVTGSAVILIDVAKGSNSEINPDGGDRVVVGSGWIAWTNGSKLQASYLK